MKVLKVLFMIVSLTFSCLFLTCYFAGRKIFEYGAPKLIESAALKNMTPQEVMQYKEWKDKKLTLPADVLEVAPFTSTTQVAAENFRAAWRKQKIRADAVVEMYFPPRANCPDAATMKRDVTELDPLIQAFKTLVDQSDYELNAITAGEFCVDLAQDEEDAEGFHWYSIPMLDKDTINACSKLMWLKTCTLVNENKAGDAFDWTAAMIRAARVNKYDSEMTQTISLDISTDGVAAWQNLVLSCTDPAYLRNELQEMNDLQKQLVFMTSPLPATIWNYVGELREIKRRGMNPEVQNLTGLEIQEATEKAKSEYEKKFFPPEKQSQSEEGQTGRNSEKNANAAKWEKTVKTVAASSFNPLFLKISVSLHDELVKKGKCVLTNFDFLRVQTAQKIWTLEHGSPAPHLASLVPNPLKELPVDRFMIGEVPFHEIGSAWYSVGPDGIDGKGKITYDPTNGTDSTGDMVAAQ